MDTILQLLKAAFELLAGLFDPENLPEKAGNRKKSVVAASKYVRLLLAFLFLTYFISVAPLFFWAQMEERKVAALEIKLQKQELEKAELKSKAEERYQTGYTQAWWELIKREALVCSEAFTEDLADIQNDVDWPSPDGSSNDKTLESIRTHLLSLEENLNAANKYHQWLKVRLPPTSQEMHAPILKALDSFRGKLMLRKSQVSAGTNLTLFKDDVCSAIEDLMEQIKKAIKHGDDCFMKNR